MLPKLTQETENLNNPVFIKAIEFVIKNTPEKTTPGPDCFSEKFYKKLKDEIILIPTQILSGNIVGEYTS